MYYTDSCLHAIETTLISLNRMNYWENTGKLREEVDVERTEEVVPELHGSRNYYTVFPECCPVKRLRWRMAPRSAGECSQEIHLQGKNKAELGRRPPTMRMQLKPQPILQGLFLEQSQIVVMALVLSLNL